MDLRKFVDAAVTLAKPECADISANVHWGDLHVPQCDTLHETARPYSLNKRV